MAITLHFIGGRTLTLEADIVNVAPYHDALVDGAPVVPYFLAGINAESVVIDVIPTAGLDYTRNG